MTGSRAYVVVSPCRDEAKFLQTTIASVASQQELPSAWIIVDDGSVDETPRMLHEAALVHPWIKVLSRPRAGTRTLGSAVIEAFTEGLAIVGLEDVDYISKLDMDVDLPATYFSSLMDLMEAQPSLATISGKPYYIDGNGRAVFERCGDENSVGMAKFYRKDAFLDIGGLRPQLMWDAIDCHSARSIGWTAGASSARELSFVHLRPMGSSDRGILRGRRRHGRGQWLMGTSPLFILASAFFRIADPPVLLGSFNMLLGYMGAALERPKRQTSEEFRRELRRYQRESLMYGKSTAAARWAERGRKNRLAPVSRSVTAD